MSPKELQDNRAVVGAKLREARKKAGLTQVQLSKKTGLCRYTINAIETGVHSWNIDSQLIYENALKFNGI